MLWGKFGSLKHTLKLQNSFEKNHPNKSKNVRFSVRTMHNLILFIENRNSETEGLKKMNSAYPNEHLRNIKRLWSLRDQGRSYFNKLFILDAQ